MQQSGRVTACPPCRNASRPRLSLSSFLRPKVSPLRKRGPAPLVTPDGAEIRGPGGRGPCRGVPAFLGPGSSPGRQVRGTRRQFWGRDDKWGGRGDSLGEQVAVRSPVAVDGAQALLSFLRLPFVTPDGAERRSGVQEGAVFAGRHWHFWVPDQVRDDKWGHGTTNWGARAQPSSLSPTTPSGHFSYQGLTHGNP